MAKSILVINPNSSSDVTRSIETVLAPFGRNADAEIAVTGLKDGPPGIQSQADVERVVPLVVNAITQRKADAYVIACYSDPGLHVARESTASPVYGIAESAMLTAMMLGQRFGVLSILHASIARHRRQIGAMGLSDRLAGDRALGLTVAELSDVQRTYRRLVEVGTRLRDDDGADVLILGCAGMGSQRRKLEAELAIPVVDPCEAAVAISLGRLYLD